MKKRILITGGAGFIGSHLADELLSHGYAVRVLDNLTPQVHGANAGRPSYLHGDVELHRGDVRDAGAVRRALEEVEAVFHLAAAVGVGQSMYQVAQYTEVNNLGTAVLLEALTGTAENGGRRAASRVERLVVASSMSVYGEGPYRAPDGRVLQGVTRWEHSGGKPAATTWRETDWEPHDADGALLTPLPTPETHAHALHSVYALSKFDQERLCLLMGNAYGLPTVALRFFNVYGPRQALSNPYTGVLAIFAARLLSGKPPLINEDGYQRRDFVHVRDVARACRLALEAPAERIGAPPVCGVFNIASGASYTIRELAARLAASLGSAIEPEITGRYRVGDIRHCFADCTKAREILGYQAEVQLEEGMPELASWLQAQEPMSHMPATVLRAQEELAIRGLSIAARI